MVTKTYKNKVQVAGIENWALHVYPVSHFYFVFILILFILDRFATAAL